jgi:hypothetical protein
MLDAAGERVRPGHARLQHRSGGAQLAQALELLDGAEPARRAQLADERCFPRWSWAGGPHRRRGALLELEPVEVRVEGEVEVEPPLLAVGDHVEPGADLVHHGGERRVAGRLLGVVGPSSRPCAAHSSSHPGTGTSR